MSTLVERNYVLLIRDLANVNCDGDSTYSLVNYVRLLISSIYFA